MMCEAPIVPPTLTNEHCTKTESYQFQSTCKYDCADGYSTKPGSYMSITCEGEDGWDYKLQDCVGVYIFYFNDWVYLSI